MTRTLTASVLAALAITSSASAASAPERIAPGGNITAVVRATDRLGWPHVPQRAEMTSIARLSLYYGVTMFGQSGSTRCYFGQHMGRARCTGTTTNRRGKVIKFRHAVQVWEDGSYRIRLIAPTRD